MPSAPIRRAIVALAADESRGVKQNCRCGCDGPGYKTRWAAAVLLLLCLGTAFGVHLPAGDTENMINFYKNLVMAGGFLYVINFGAGVLSFDDGVPAR